MIREKSIKKTTPQVSFHSIKLLPFLLLIALITGCEKNTSSTDDLNISLRQFDHKVGTKFTAIPDNPYSAPTAEEIPITLPEKATNADAIWGATGRDDEGNIYFGVSTHGLATNKNNDSRTAYLYQYNPITNATTLQSDVVSELKYNGIFREGMGQNKLHSKFYEANDGYLYFSSFDEAGEDDGINPTWGGHLWRKKPNDKHWQHVLSTAEALVAVNTNGRYVYALGYWDHVLYRYDTQTNNTKRIVVGSVSTHVSRNFLVDENGHAFVPFLKENDYNEIEVYLNEYNPSLALVGSYPMPAYRHEKIKHHHGIIGYTMMENGDIYFTTSEGGLYQLKLGSLGQKLIHHDNMHPEGQSYIPSLFTFSGENYVIGLTNKNKNTLDWLIFDTNLKTSINVISKINGFIEPDFWGSLTKDNFGNFYAAGWQKSEDRKKRIPVIIRLSIP
ncbi:MAG: hypothetical protein ACSHW0_18055 [Thalassotalea sp.]